MGKMNKSVFIIITMAFIVVSGCTVKSSQYKETSSEASEQMETQINVVIQEALSTEAEKKETTPVLPKLSDKAEENTQPVLDEYEAIQEVVKLDESMVDCLEIKMYDPIYNYEDFRIAIYITNNDDKPVQVTRDFYIDKKNGEEWEETAYNTKEAGKLDNPDVQLAIEQKEKRFIGVYIGKLRENGYMDIGEYRIRVPINGGEISATYIVKEEVERDNSKYKMEVLDGGYDVENDEFTVKTTNFNGFNVALGATLYPQLEIYRQDKWEEATRSEVDTKEYPSIGRSPFLANSSEEHSLSFGHSYRVPLEIGKYRASLRIGPEEDPARNVMYAQFNVG